MATATMVRIPKVNVSWEEAADMATTYDAITMRALATVTATPTKYAQYIDRNREPTHLERLAFRAMKAGELKARKRKLGPQGDPASVFYSVGHWSTPEEMEDWINRPSCQT